MVHTKGTSVPSSLVRRLARDKAGQDLAEYGLLLSMIGLGTGIAAIGVGENVRAILELARTVMEAVIGS